MDDCLSKYEERTLQDLKNKYPDNLIFSYLNINSVRNKFKDLEVFLNGSVDVLTIAETKLDDSFPTQQFLMSGFKRPFRLDNTDKSGGLLVYIKSDLPARPLNRFEIDKSYEILCIEINLHSKRWFLLSFYRNPKSNLNQYLDKLSDVIDFFSTSYDNILVMGDLNAEPSSPVVENFLNLHDLYCHINQNTCWKTAHGTCIDLILSNRKHSFQHTGSVETGISDHHNLVYTILKTKFIKNKSRKIFYRDYRHFRRDSFLLDLDFHLQNYIFPSYEIFESTFCMILDQHAPMKTKFLRANNKPHMSKQLRKAIMTRSRLKNKANKTRSDIDIANYRLQRNLVVNLNRQAKKSYISSIGPKESCKFWEFFKPYFSDKGKAEDVRIQLLEDNNLITNEIDISNIFNEHFNSVTSTLNIPSWPFANFCEDPILNIVKNYTNHPSIIAIKQKFSQQLSFDFKPVTSKDVAKIINSLNKSKAVGGKIPVKLIQLSVDICAPILASCFNQAILDCEFPENLKLADIIPCFKKGDMHDKANFRPISLLPPVSKIFEKIMVAQMTPTLDQIFSKFLCGYRRKHSTQHALLSMLRKWQTCIANKDKVGAILMDLSKAFDCLSHKLLIAKLEAYGFGKRSLEFLLSYLSNRKHRVRIGNSFSEWLELNLGVPQGSVLGPILFNIFLNDLFIIFDKSDLCNFADDNSLSACAPSLDIVINILIKSAAEILRWYDQNSLVANPAKFQVIFPGSPNLNIEFNLNGHLLKSSNIVKLLGISIDDKLMFLPHIKDLTRRANNKIKALLRLSHNISESRRNILFQTFIISFFNYCPLIWIFGSKQANTLLEKCHFRALRARFLDFSSSYENLLKKGETTSLHVRNLRLMLEEVFKSFHGLSPPILHGIFKAKNLNYSLRSGLTFQIPASKVHVNSFEFRAIMAWNHLPKTLKCTDSLSEFRRNLQTVRVYCNCKACC